MKTFIAECRRRRVFRLAGLYIVVAWVVLQVADLAFESWNIPSAALRFIWIGTIVGFPVAMIFGWWFDIVGGRIIRTQDSDDIDDLSLHRTDFFILAAVAIAIIATVYGVVTEVSGVRAPETDQVTKSSVDPRLIAVLPFKDTSSDKENAGFLASGIQDDLLTRLSRIDALR